MEYELLGNSKNNKLKIVKNKLIKMYANSDRQKLNRIKIISIICLLVIAISVFTIIFSNIKYNKMVEKREREITEEKAKEEERKLAEEQKRKEEEERKKREHIPSNISNAAEVVGAIYSGKEKKAFLTFDDGPSKITPQILDVLKEENVKATFFVLGKMVKINPEILKREKEEGHYIANHSYSHEYDKIYSSTDAVLDEYNRCEEAIKEVLGQEYNTFLFRFPGGSYGGKSHNVKQKAKAMLAEKNIASTNWNCLTGDAAGNNSVESQMKEFNDTRSKDRNLIVLMHDAGDKKYTPETLRQVIKTLKDEGYTFHNFYEIFKSEEQQG